jgi:hypothetical protein
MKGESLGGEYEILVLKCHWAAVSIFKKCQLTFVGMTGTCVGLSATEIRNVLAVTSVPKKSWKSLMSKLQFMGREAASYLNDRKEK